MYYEDGYRRVNLLSGLSVGLVLGIGAALLLPTPARRRAPRRIRDSASKVQRSIGKDLEALEQWAGRLRRGHGSGELEHRSRRWPGRAARIGRRVGITRS